MKKRRILLALLANNPIALFFGAVLAVIFVWYMNESFKDKLTARREEILAQFQMNLLENQLDLSLLHN